MEEGETHPQMSRMDADRERKRDKEKRQRKASADEDDKDRERMSSGRASRSCPPFIIFIIFICG
jgi:hypothetical protein